jgi:hypothetical protein
MRLLANFIPEPSFQRFARCRKGLSPSVNCAMGFAASGKSCATTR